ncbi:amine oxidase catalytic domain-containing protein [Suillus fuscotomentosus]|uniref:Amine oxidase n=1 Tax=Suillus fuscotomentosus TaxID=1912939 RepID=A0AAD4EKS8_9AGAM|nr:amine oxidase catalytic domain-containing protein [Suillus fuscotomentosus]KAG1906828.1 amine oxidase catalytic domain-containing protein [Suillus fuscotomentosus]
MPRRYEQLKTASLDEPKRESTRAPNRITSLRLGLSFILILVLASLTVIQIRPSTSKIIFGGSETLADYDEDIKICASNIPPPARPPAPINPWASLTIDEMVEIQNWLLSTQMNLNLTRGDTARPSDNSIYMIQTYYPPKADVLEYFSSLDPRDAPARFARVTIHHGGAVEPVIRDYLVGPLPVTPATEMTHLANIYHTETLPYNARGYDALDWNLPEIHTKIAAPLMDAYKASGLPNGTIVAGGAGPFGFDGSVQALLVELAKRHARILVASTESLAICRLFDTAESFMDAFHNGTLKRVPPVTKQEEDLSWSTRERIGALRDLDNLPGPRSVSFAGLRFRVDYDLQYVSWMGWGLYLGFDRDMGLNLWDIRFRGERIIYELKPQEALAQYTGNDPYKSSTALLDSYFGMGQSVRDLLPGYDCPDEAIYLPATTFSATGMMSRKRAICIFEQDSGRPISRHLGFEQSEFGAVKGYQLVIRSVATVGNYDYLFEYIFHVDGTIEVRVSASGYLLSGFWDDEQGAYGSKIWNTTLGSLHDHVINFKVLKIYGGIQNSLLKTSLSQEVTTQPWFDDDWGEEVIQQKITREYIDNEDEALLRFPANFQGGYTIVNTNETNKWGIPRGYAIHPGYSPVHNTVVGSKRLLKNANWARYHLAVSRRKDTEPSSSSMWNFNLPGAPPVDFHNFFDGENITQQDLVTWINVGMHHLPASEDVPNTRTNTAASSFFLTPFNYFDYDVSIESANAILLQPPKKPGDPFSYDDYNVRPAHCVPQPPAAFEYYPEQVYDLDGKPAPPSTVEEMRKASELYLRIKFEL